jgi:catechol 2,3-dioxygenase-like lactoylglutathione lyase family enzyme
MAPRTRKSTHARPKKPTTRTKAGPKARPRARTGAAPQARPRLASIAVVVSDRQRSVRWYTETLGLEHLTDMEHWQTVGEKGRPTEIHICQVSEYDDTAPLEPGNAGIALRVAGDFVAACQALADRGVEFSVPATHAEWGWWAMVKDPDGNELTILPED